MQTNLTLPPFLKQIFAGSASTLVSSVKGLIDTIDAPKEQRAQLAVDMEKEANRHLEATEAQLQDNLKNYLVDIHDARNLQIEALKQADLFSKRFVYLLASIIVLITLGYDFVMLFKEVPAGNKDLCNIIAGALNTSCLATVVGFFFGSSKSSEDKGKVISDMAVQITDGK